MARKKERNALVIVDMQNDFMDKVRDGIFPGGRTIGALPVPGAYDDSQRLVEFIKKNGARLDEISFTHDSHDLHIATPIMWVDKDGKHPDPFTNIFYDDAAGGTWRINSPLRGHQEKGIKYLKDLKDGARYVLTIWFPHCQIGSAGAAIQEDVLAVTVEWRDKYVATLTHVTKGSNPWTEHYSGMMAAQVDPEDPTTALNKPFINMIQEYDNIFFAGEALNFCVRETMLDIIRNFDPDNVKKIVLLTDCTSAIQDSPATGNLFQSFTDSFIAEAKGAGMREGKSTDSWVNLTKKEGE